MMLDYTIINDTTASSYNSPKVKTETAVCHQLHQTMLTSKTNINRTWAFIQAALQGNFTATITPTLVAELLLL